MLKNNEGGSIYIPTATDEAATTSKQRLLINIPAIWKNWKIAWKESRQT
jgi:hypothetical protein